MKKKYVSHLLLFIVTCIYGVNYIVTKEVFTTNLLHPFAFVFLRVLFGSVLFFLVFKIFINEKILRKDYFQFFLCGIFGVVINQLGFFFGLKYTSPTNASLIMTSTPIIVLILGRSMGMEKLSFPKLFGICLGIIGASFLILSKGSLSLSNSGIIGDLSILINACSYAFYLLIVKRLLDKYHPLTIVTYMFIIALPFVGLVSFPSLFETKWTQLPSFIYWSILYVILFTTFLAYLFNALALRNIKSSTASSYIYLQPLIAASLSIYIGIEVFEFNKLISAVLIFSGVYFVSKSSKHDK